MTNLNQKIEHRTGDFNLPSLIRENPNMPQGERVRRLIRWRVPGAGFLDMYINPQNITIKESKVIQSQLTKGGYVVQYWGEQLPVISLSGTTASSGIEGINILRSIYRSEQDAFTQVARTMSERLNSILGSSSIGGFVSSINSSAVAATAGSIVGTVFGGGNSSSPLYPTLASLALGVEMYYQGWVFKGFFVDFSVTESVSIGPGVFEYSMTFHVTDRRGVRKNFMDWHRSPATIDKTGNYSDFKKSDPSTVPPNFKEEV